MAVLMATTFLPSWATDWTRRLSSADDDPYEMLLGPVFGGDGSPDEWRTILCIIVILTLGSLSAGAGVGGGGIYVPVFSVALGLSTKAAAPLTKITVLGGSIGSMFFICFKPHPNAPKRPLIDYEVGTFMQCGELLGVTIGVICNVLLPDIIIMIFLVIVLAFNGYRTLRKARIMYKQETAALASEARLDLSLKSPLTPAVEESVTYAGHRAKRDMHHFLDQHGLGSMKQALEDNGVYSLYDLEDDQWVTDEFLVKQIKITPAEVHHLRDSMQRLRLEAAVTVAPSYDADVVEAHSARRLRDSHRVDGDAVESPRPTNKNVEVTVTNHELQKLYNGIAVQFPRWAYGLTLFMVIYTFVYAWVKADYLNPCYSNVGVYYLWLVSPFLVLGGCSLGVGYYLSRLHDKRIALGYQYLGTDVQWTTYRQYKFTLVAILAGFAAGLLGIGGGMILGPLFVEMGMQPQSSAATCAFMIFWTGVSAVVQYYFQGLFSWQWLVVFGSLGFVSGQIGQRSIYHIIKKSSRPSFIVFVLGFIIMLALVLMTVTSSINLAADWTTTSEMFAIDTEWTLCSYYED